MQTESKQTIRWGIIGCGDVTEVKSGPALKLASNSSLVAVMRRNGALAQDFTKHRPNPALRANPPLPSYNRWFGPYPAGARRNYPMQQQTMKALVKRKPEQGIWMEEVPVPEA